MSKLAQRKEAYKAQKADIKRLRELVKTVAEVAEIDSSRVATRIKMARKSYLGEALALCQIIASIYNYPLNRGDSDYTSIPAKQADIEAVLGSDAIEALIDLSEAKGYNTFLTDEMVEMPAVTPDVEQLELLASVLADELEVPTLAVDKEIITKYDKAEVKALANVKAELEALSKAIKDTVDVSDMLN